MSPVSLPVTLPNLPALPVVLPPISQKFRPIGLVLWEDGGGMHSFFVFSLRPEEITYDTPTRTNVIQTLGGAWLDEFGLGIAQISVQGHTGWHSTKFAGVPGEVFFHWLHDGIFTRYFKLRKEAVDAGKDPDKIQCLLIDTLNLRVANVVPGQFQLRRHRTRPLLFQYRLSFQALDLMNATSTLKAAASAIGGALGL